MSLLGAASAAATVAATAAATIAVAHHHPVQKARRRRSYFYAETIDTVGKTSLAKRYITQEDRMDRGRSHEIARDRLDRLDRPGSRTDPLKDFGYSRSYLHVLVSARAGYGAEVHCWVVGLGVSAKHIARARKRRRAV